MTKNLSTSSEIRIKILYSHHALVRISYALLHKNYNFMRVSHKKIIIVHSKNAQKFKYTFRDSHKNPIFKPHILKYIVSIIAQELQFYASLSEKNDYNIIKKCPKFILHFQRLA